LLGDFFKLFTFLSLRELKIKSIENFVSSCVTEDTLANSRWLLKLFVDFRELTLVILFVIFPKQFFVFLCGLSQILQVEISFLVLLILDPRVLNVDLLYAFFCNFSSPDSLLLF
jgi:hypothetical protein